MADGRSTGDRRAGAELLLPALAVVCGLQAWRAAAVTLVGWHDARPGGARLAIGSTLLAVSLLVPVGIGLARRFGASRTAAGAAAAMAALRLTAQIGGVALTGWFALLGAGLFAVWCSLWASLAPRGRLFGVAIGFVLAQLDLALANGLDLLYQPGLVAAGWSLAFAVPLLLLAVSEAAGHDHRAPEASPAVLGMPLVMALAAGVFCHPVRLAAQLGGELGRASALLLIACVAALYLGHGARRLLRESIRAGAASGLRLRFWAIHLGASAIAALSLLAGAPLLPLAAAVLPTAVAVALAPLFECWPVGRRHRGTVTVAQATWLLGAMLLAAGDSHTWPSALALVVLHAFGLIALWHLPDRESLPPVAEPGWRPLLFLLLVPALCLRQLPGPTPGVLAAMPAVRVASLDCGGGRDADGRPALAAQAARLAELRPHLVLVRGVREGRALQQMAVAWWLARRLDLVVVRVPREPDLLILAPELPAEIARPDDAVLVAGFNLGGRSLGLADIGGERISKSRARRASEALRNCSMGLIAADFRPPLGGLVRPGGLGWRNLGDALPEVQEPSLLLVRGGWTAITLDMPADAPVPGRLVTGLLRIHP